MHHTKEEVKAILEKTVSSIKEDIKAVERFAEAHKISISINNENYLISHRLTETFPILHLTNFSYFAGNGNNSNLDGLWNIISHTHYHAFHTIRLDSTNEKQRTIKVSGSNYDMIRFADYFVFGKDAFNNVVKEFQNGMRVIALSEEDFRRFNILLNWTDENTAKIMASITEADKADYKEKCKRPSYNRYYWAHERAEKLGLVNSGYMNFYVILKKLESK